MAAADSMGSLSGADPDGMAGAHGSFPFRVVGGASTGVGSGRVLGEG